MTCLAHNQNYAVNRGNALRAKPLHLASLEVHSLAVLISGVLGETCNIFFRDQLGHYRSSALDRPLNMAAPRDSLSLRAYHFRELTTLFALHSRFDRVRIRTTNID